MNAADRIALLLGRAIMRAETLQAELEQARARIAELENESSAPSGTLPSTEPEESS